MHICIPKHASDIIKTLSAHGYEAYVVGGCVRDSILGKEPADWDITTSALPEQVKALFPRTIDTGLKHGTVTIMMDKVGYECYDIVAANILADVLVALTPVVVNQIKKGGIYITSGIIDDKEETVVEAVKKAGLEVLDITYQGEWVCVTARKN